MTAWTFLLCALDSYGNTSMLLMSSSSSSSNSDSTSRSWFLNVLMELDPMSESANSTVLVVPGYTVMSAIDTAVVDIFSKGFLV